MKYTKEQRLNIGKQIYANEFTKYEAAEQYNIGVDCAREYMRLYRNVNNLPPKNTSPYGVKLEKTFAQVSKKNLPEYEAMTKEELIKELIKSKVNEARLKKGYTVEGVGAEKVFIPLDNKNTK